MRIDVSMNLTTRVERYATSATDEELAAMWLRYRRRADESEVARVPVIIIEREMSRRRMPPPSRPLAP